MAATPVGSGGGHVTDPASSALPSVDARQKRLKLREAGQKKFQEWKEARRHQQPAASPAGGGARPVMQKSEGLGDAFTSQPSSSTTFLLTTPFSAGQQQQQQQGSPGTPTHSSAPPAGSAPSNGSMVLQPGPRQSSPSLQEAPSGCRDPLVDMLLLQVESLMRDKAALQQQNVALKRENEQLQELVGYLSEQQPEQASPRWEQASPRWEQASPKWEQTADGGQRLTCLDDHNNRHDEACYHPLEQDAALASASKRRLASCSLGSGGGSTGLYGSQAGQAGDDLDEDYCLVEEVHPE